MNENQESFPPLDWETALSDVNLKPTYEFGTPEYDRAISAILDEQQEITRSLMLIRQQIDNLLDQIPDSIKIELTFKEGNVDYKGPEVLAVEALKREMDELIKRSKELEHEMARLGGGEGND